MKLTTAATSLLVWYFHQTTAQQEHEFVSRIVGGEQASAGEFPFLVSWHYDINNDPDCGGSLVAPNLVLSAAHCAGITGGVRVGSLNARSRYNGSPPGVEAGVKSEIMHPDYNDRTTANDYMILELDRDIDTSIYPPINLNFDAQKPAVGEMLTVIGFGRLEEGGEQPDKLMKVDVPVVNHDICNRQYDGSIEEEIMLCAGYAEGGKDSCQGDSGGPIFKNINGVTTQVGVVSFGIGCALPDYSGVYARTSGVSSWLKTEICSRSSAPKPSYCEGSQPTPSPPPNQTPPSDCTDSPTGWHDSDGTEYDCLWYAQENNCANYGDQYENMGKTANEACCACGGGDRGGSSPTVAPEPGDWEIIMEDDFEDGWGNFRGQRLQKVDGTRSMRLKRTQNVKTSWISVSDYSQLSVDLWFMSKRMESGDKFAAEFRFDNGSGWMVAREWAYNEFQNNQWNEASATIDIPPSATKMRVRFRCNSNQNNDVLFIDDVAVFGK